MITPPSTATPSKAQHESIKNITEKKDIVVEKDGKEETDPFENDRSVLEADSIDHQEMLIKQYKTPDFYKSTFYKQIASQKRWGAVLFFKWKFKRDFICKSTQAWINM